MSLFLSWRSSVLLPCLLIREAADSLYLVGMCMSLLYTCLVSLSIRSYSVRMLGGWSVGGPSSVPRLMAGGMNGGQSVRVALPDLCQPHSSLLRVSGLCSSVAAGLSSPSVGMILLPPASLLWRLVSQQALKNSEEWFEGVEGKQRMPQFEVAVCASGVWPQTASKETFIYPPLAVKLHEAFQAFYTSKHAGRALSWIPHLGVCEIKANFNINVSRLFLVLLVSLLWLK